MRRRACRTRAECVEQYEVCVCVCVYGQATCRATTLRRGSRRRRVSRRCRSRLLVRSTRRRTPRRRSTSTGASCGTRSSRTATPPRHHHVPRPTVTSKQQVYSSSQGCHAATGTHMPHGITQCYLPPGRGDIPASAAYDVSRIDDTHH